MKPSIQSLSYSIYIYLSITLSFIILKNLYKHRERVSVFGPILYFGTEMIGTLFVFIIKYINNINVATLIFNVTLPLFVIGAYGANMLVFTYVLRYKKYKKWQIAIAYITIGVAIISYVYMGTINTNPFLIDPYYDFYKGMPVFKFQALTSMGNLIKGINFFISTLTLIILVLNCKKIKSLGLGATRNIIILGTMVVYLFVIIGGISSKLGFFNAFEIGLMSVFLFKVFIVFDPKDKNILYYDYIDRFYVMDHIGIGIIILGEEGNLLDYNLNGESFIEHIAVEKSKFGNLRNELEKKIKDFNFEENIGLEKHYEIESIKEDISVTINIKKISALVKSNPEEKCNYIILVKDITSVRKEKLAIKSYYSVFEAVGSGVIIFNKKNEIIEINSITQEITQYSEKDLIGQNILILNKEGDSNSLELKILNEIELYDYWKGYLLINRKYDEPVWVYVSVNTILDEYTGFANYVMVISEITDEFKDLQKQADYDPLTRIYNRNGLFKNAKSLLEGKEKTYLMMIDLDNFKRVNDTYGHLKGDKVLKDFAKVSLDVIGKAGLIGRYGGEEFLVIIDGRYDQLDLIRIADQILASVRNLEFDHQGEKFKVTCSIGIVVKRPKEKLLSAINRADEMLYQAKNTGKDKYQIDFN